MFKQAIYNEIKHVLEDHIHSPQQIAPLGSAAAAMTAGAGAYVWGNFVELMAAGTTTSQFDLHWAVITNPDTNGDYEIEFVYGAADTHAAYLGFTRTSNLVEIVPMPLMTEMLPAGSRIRARIRHSAGAHSVTVAKIYYHEY